MWSSSLWLLSWHRSEAAAPRPEDANFVVIWDIKTGARRRGFKREGVTGGWPFFLWSHDDKYFARCGENTISIYDSSVRGMIFGRFAVGRCVERALSLALSDVC